LNLARWNPVRWNPVRWNPVRWNPVRLSRRHLNRHRWNQILNRCLIQSRNRIRLIQTRCHSCRRMAYCQSLNRWGQCR
jgi:hypothetical protein